MLNLITLDSKIILEPYGTILITDPIHKQYQSLLANTYPSQHFKEFSLSQQTGNERIDANFTFQFEWFNLQKTDEISLKNMGFDSLWVQLIHFLLSDKYIQQLGEAVGMDLTQAKPLIEFSRYRPGDWLDAHYDKQTHKILTQLFYFNTFWDTRWGGYFHLLHPQVIDKTVLAIPPLINYSVIIKPDPIAWHKVEKVAINALQPRLNLVLEFYEKSMTGS